MKQVFVRRLLKVAQALRESPNPKMFTMVKFGHSCGTPACALGHYAARRDLQKRFGLLPGPLQVDDAYSLTCAGDYVCYADSEVTEHFGIDSLEAERMFGGNGCGGAQTPKAAASFIERFVGRKVRESKAK